MDGAAGRNPPQLKLKTKQRFPCIISTVPINRDKKVDQKKKISEFINSPKCNLRSPDHFPADK